MTEADAQAILDAPPEQVPVPGPPVIIIDSDDEGQKGNPKLSDDDDFEADEPKKGEGRKRKPKAKAAPKRKAKMQKVEHFSIDLPEGDSVMLMVNGRPFIVDCDLHSGSVSVVKLMPAFRE